MTLQNYQMLIDGRWVAASDGGTFPSLDPATGKTWAEFPEATTEDVARAVAAAERALSGPWGRMTPTERGKCLSRLANLLADNSEAIGRVETQDTGKLLKETRWQAKYIAEYLHYFAGAADKIEGRTLPIDKPDMFVFTDRVPIGVIAAVIPWNSQIFLSCIKLGPALAAGNTVVFKASEDGPAPLLELGKLVADAGIPDGVVNILTGHADPCGVTLTSHPGVGRIAFTGGPASARHVIRNSASNLAEVSLELGGKSPFLVFDDADIENAVNGAVAGIFGASGQSCVAGSRLYLQAGIADEFLDRLIEIASGIQLGDPMADSTEMGPLCTAAQLAHIKSQISGAQDQGAKILAGGAQPSDMDGFFFYPTIIECPRQDMDIVDTELFGPVLAVQRFETEDDAVRLANTTRHGLAAGVFSQNATRTLRVSKALRAGIIWVNTYRAISPIAEIGGFGESGYGREGGLQAVYDYTRSKTIWMNMSDAPISNPFQPR